MEGVVPTGGGVRPKKALIRVVDCSWNLAHVIGRKAGWHRAVGRCRAILRRFGMPCLSAIYG